MSKNRYLMHELSVDHFPPPLASRFGVGKVLGIRTIGPEVKEFNFRVVGAHLRPRGSNAMHLVGKVDHYGGFESVEANVWVNDSGRIFLGIDARQVHQLEAERDADFMPAVQFKAR